MNVQGLIDELEQGADDAAVEIAAVTLADRAVDPAAVLELLAHPLPAVRRAATLALGQRRDPGALEALRTRLSDSHAPVRAAAAQALSTLGEPGAAPDVLGLLGDRMAAVREAAALAAGAFPQAAVLEGLERSLEREASLDVKAAAARSLVTLGQDPERRLAALGALARLVGRESDPELVHPATRGVEALSQGLTRATLVEVLREVPISGRAPLAEALSTLEAPGPLLTRMIRELKSLPPDGETLARFGSNLTQRALDLPRCYGRDEEVFAVLRHLGRAGPRAVVLVGPAGVGKSAVVHALARQLAQEESLVPRVVHEVTTGEVLSGTRYLGEWQTRLKELQEALSSPHRAVWYLPDLNRLVDAGTTAHSDESFATMLRPALERGELAIVGESTPEAFRHGLDRFPGFRKLFFKLELEEPDARRTLEILESVTEDLLARHRARGLALEAPRAALELAVELADDYSSGLARPGSAISLVREALNDLAEEEREAEGPRVLDGSRLLHTISRQSGVPVALLDDSVQLDLREVQAFFEDRVLGQSEATEAMVDLIGRIKAGLTDPSRPLGVFFFVGPTGVGKTEMAKTVAEYIFGSPERLVRIDLGEFKEPDAHRRLVGDPLAVEPSMRSGLLTAPVRERPFSVVLLDEVEKAHRNVFDLLLPLMAEGRLTDERGRVTDFRHTIVIMTSNLGSDLREDTAIGFGLAPAHEKIQRVMEEVFRPEFLNRIGKTILFSPLSVEVMRRLTRREVRRVLGRRGIRRRGVIVELDDSLVGALVRDGFSARYGARPLKRRVEEVVLNPLARALLKIQVDGPQAIVRLGVNQGRPAWELILERKDDPDDDDALAVSRPTARIKDVHGRRVSLDEFRERVDELHGRVEAMESSIEDRDLRGRKSELLKASTAPDLWDDPARASRILSEIHQLEVQLDVPRRLSKRLTSLDGLLERAERRSQETALLTDLLVRLDDVARDVEFSDYALRCSSPHERGDAYLLLRRVGTSDFPKDAIALMVQMYRRYWKAKGQRARVVYEGVSHRGVLREAAILLEGTCAYGLFRGEHGLHQWVQRSGENQRQKEVCFVRVTPLYPAAEPLRAGELTQEVRAVRDEPGVLLKRPRAHLVLTHTPTSVALEGHTDGSEEAKDWARALLAARVARAHDRLETLDPGVIRRYVSGRSSVAREFASNLKLPLERVLEGELDEFILPRVYRA